MYQVQLTWQNSVLALFIPVVLALAESVAIQSVTLALESVREADASWRGLFKRMRPEVLTALMLGLSAGLLVGALASVLWQGIALLFAIVLGGIAIGASLAPPLRV